MKKPFYSTLIVLSLMACDKTTTETEVAVSFISLNLPTAEMIIGETVQLQASINPSSATDKTIMWGSSKQSVATVSNSGLVTAIAEGSSTITASAGGKSATCTVTVSKGVVAVASVTLNKSELNLKKGESETLVATVNPADATDKTVTWSSSDATIASVNQNGLVTALKSGNVTITAKAGEKTATCTVIVIVPVEGISLNFSTKTLKQYETLQLSATVTPVDATNAEITWSSSNSNIATVSGNGLVKAIDEGTAVITAQAGGKTATCTITVTRSSAGGNEGIGYDE